MPPLRLALLLGAVAAFWGAPPLARAAVPAPAAAAALPTLTKTRQILSLTHEQAARHYPVRVTGVVTYCYFPKHGPWVLFVQDDSGGIFVSGPGPHVAVGQRVEVTGISDSGEFAPKIHRTGIKVLGTAPLPNAVRKPFEDLVSGKEDCQWVEINGIVRSARLREPGGDLLLLDIATGGGRITVQVLLDDDRDFERLVDAEVDVRGVAATVLNRRQQLLAVEIYTKGLDEIAVEVPAAPDPYSIATSRIGNLLQFSRSGRFGHRVKIVGAVTFRDRRGTLYVRDSTGALLVQTPDATPVQVGDVVEVLGFPAAGSFSPFLQDAIFRRTGARAMPPPHLVQAPRLIDGRYDADLIMLEGRVLETARTMQQEILTVQSDDVVFTASLDGAAIGRDTFPPGTLVRLIGICAVTAGAERTVPKSFHLLLRSPADVAVLRTPSWWTPARVLRVLGGVVVVMVIAFGWIVVISRNNILLREHRRIQQEILDISGREQTRIAQDLHDGVCQQLGAVAFLTKILEEDLRGAAPRQAQAAREISQHLADAIAQTRTVARGLLPVQLEENGLESALEELAAQTTKLFKIDCDFHCDRAARLSDNDAARNLYYVAYEAVNNAVKHAGARAITIELECTDHDLVLRVTNDGKRFTASGPQSRGMGLHIMKYRAQAIGATFDITSSDEAACTVTCTLPVPTRPQPTAEPAP